MTHLEIENLASEYLEGSLAPARQAQVDEHLAACAACRELMEDMRSAIQACHEAAEVPAPPWLVARIRHATLGEKPPSWLDQLRALPRLFRQPRLVYGIATAVFSVSIIANAAGLRFQNLTMSDLNPATWYNQVNRAGHLFYAHAEKFYYDLRIVYEIESRFRDAQVQNGGQENQPGRTKTSPASPASTSRGRHMKLAFENTGHSGIGYSGISRSTSP